MGAKCSSPLKKTWFSRKSGNIRKISSVAPLMVKPVEDLNGTLRLLMAPRTPSPRTQSTNKHEVKSIVLAAGEHNEEHNVEEHREDYEEHQEIHYNEIEYSVPAEIKTHYFNSYTQEWYVYKRTQQVTMYRYEPQLSFKESLPSTVDSEYENIDSKYENIDSKYENIDSEYQNNDSKFENIDSKYQHINSKDQNLNSKFQNIDCKYKNIDSYNKSITDMFTASCFKE